MKHFLLLLIATAILRVGNAQTAEAYYQKGLAAANAGEFFDAVLSYTAAIDINPYESQYYQARGYANFSIKSYKEALEDYNMAFKLKPKHENKNCLFLRGRLFLEMRTYEDAIRDFTDLLYYFPNDIETKYGSAHLFRGKAYLYSGKKDKACEDFHEASNRRMADARPYIKDFCQ
jgi:tetratricopeptide (TPR) repeat protein